MSKRPSRALAGIEFLAAHEPDRPDRSGTIGTVSSPRVERARTVAPMSGVHFVVLGEAKPAGSKTAFAFRRGDGSLGARVTDASGAKGKAWRVAVATGAAEAMGDSPPMDGPLRLTIRIVRQRPKGHYRRDGTVLPRFFGARPTTRPDITKLVRAIEDAMTGIVWRDDAQVVDQHAQTFYGDRPRARIGVEAIE